MRKVVLFFLLVCASYAKAQTCNAASASEANVLTALTACAAGGTVVIPAGTATWASQMSVTITGPVTIQGATVCTGGCAAGSAGVGLAFTDNTTITTTSAGNNPALVINGCSATKFIRVTGLTFINTAGNTAGSVQFNCSTLGQVSYRMDHLHITNQASVFFTASEGVGLSDHLLYSGNGDYSYSIFTGDFSTIGYQNWANPTVLGSSNANIIEDSNFTGATPAPSISGITDGNTGCSVVIRYNQIKDMTAGITHGTDSGGERACITAEIYNNAFTNDSVFAGSTTNPWASRGGVTLFHDNVLGGSFQWKSLELDYYRVSLSDAFNSTTWGFANPFLNWTPQTQGGGINTLNAAAYQTAHTYAANSSVKDSTCNLYTSAGGTTGGSAPSCPAYLATVTDSGGVVWLNVGGTTSAGPGGSGFLSTAPDTTCISGGTCTRNFDSAGGYPYRDQPCVIHNQVVFGCYQWNNSGSQVPSTWWATDASSAVQLNRDYFSSAPASYTPYTYPDPLQITTWFTDPVNGGPRTSTGNPGVASCTGRGTSVFNPAGADGQACPFKVARYLWNDPFVYQDAGWLPFGGDIMEFRNMDVTHPSEMSGSTGNFGDGCWGIGPYCSPPPTPSGTAVAHTIIRGQNYTACSTTDSFGTTIADPAKIAYLWAGGGTGQLFDVSTSQHVDFSCMQWRSHSSCNGINLSCSGTEWAGRGLWTGSTAANSDINLTNVQITGFQSRGIIGNIGGNWNLTNVEISFNGSAGWDLDPGFGSTRDSLNAVVVMDNNIVQWNGCSRQYPDVNAIPVQALSCTYDTNGGYGDGVGTPPDVGILSWTMIHSRLAYNTQDAIDLGHLLSGAVVYKRNLLFGNAGGALKVGNATSLTEYNNFSEANCTRMAQPITGAVSNYNAVIPGQDPDLCRAGGDQNTFNFDPINLSHRLDADIEYNTFIGTGSTVMDAQCFGTCTPGTTGLTYTFIFANNTVRGYTSTMTTPTPPYPYNAGIAPGMFNNLPPTTQAKNLFFGLNGCPANGSDISPTCALSNGFVSQPASPITAESQLDNYNFYPDTGSALIHAGTYNASVPLDFYGVTRPNPPTVGAAEPSGVAPPTHLQQYGTVKAFGTQKVFAQ